jgi:hypothetical protein
MELAELPLASEHPQRVMDLSLQGAVERIRPRQPLQPVMKNQGGKGLLGQCLNDVDIGRGA